MPDDRKAVKAIKGVHAAPAAGVIAFHGMLATQSAQVRLFDAAVVMGPLPEGSFFALLAEHGDRIVRDSDFGLSGHNRR